jgi:hypothetical protein
MISPMLRVRIHIFFDDSMSTKHTRVADRPIATPTALYGYFAIGCPQFLLLLAIQSLTPSVHHFVVIVHILFAYHRWKSFGVRLQGLPSVRHAQRYSSNV